MTREEILDGIAKTDKVINNPIIPEAVKQVAINTKAKLQAQLDAMGGEAPKVEKEEIVEKVEVEKEVEKPAKKERVKFERKPRTPKAPKKEKEKETESPESKAEKSMEGKKLSVENCRELLAKLKTRREGAKKRVATRKKQGKPAQLTTIEVLKKASDNLEKKVETEVNKDGKLQKTTIKRSTKEVVDIVATIISGIPTKAERTEYINEVIADLKKLIDKVEPITEKMEKGGYMADGGKLESGVYRIGKPKKIDANLYEQKIVEIFDNGDISTASDYGRKLGDFKSQMYPVITQEQFEEQYKYAKGGYMADGGINQNYEGLEIIIPSNYQNKNKLKGDIEAFIGDDYEDRGNKIFVRNKDVYGHGVTLSQLKDLYEYINNNYGQIEVELFAKGGIFSRGPLEFKDSIQGSDGDYTYNLTFQPINNISKLYIDDNDNGKSTRFADINYSIVESFAQEFQDLMDEYEDEFTETDWSFEGEVKSLFHDDKKYGASSRKGIFTIFIGDKSSKFKSGSLMQSLAESFIELAEKVGDRGYDDQEYAKGGDIGQELMGGQPNQEKPSGAILLEVRKKGKEIVVTEDDGKTKELYVKSNGFSGYTLRYKGNQYEFAYSLDSYAKGGELKDASNLTEQERFELKVLKALSGWNKGLNINSLYEVLGFSNYRFNQYATDEQVDQVKNALSSLMNKGYVEDSAFGYGQTIQGRRYIDSFQYGSYRDGGMMAKGGKITRNKNKNDWKAKFDFFVDNNYQPIGKRDLINMAYESSNGIDSAIPQSMYGDVDNTAYYVYDYQTDKMGELVDLREKLKFSNVKVNVTIVQDDKLKYGNDLPSELQDVTFHQALNYVFNNDSIEQFAIRPKK